MKRLEPASTQTGSRSLEPPSDASVDHLDLVAHTPGDSLSWHGLGEHLRATAELAAEFGLSLGIGDAAWWTGLWHDVGKGGCVFQGYLRLAATDPAMARVRFPDRDHKRAGAALALAAGLPSAAFAVLGHHGGLPAATEVREGQRAGLLWVPDDVVDLVQEALGDLRLRPPDEWQAPWPKNLSALDQEMLTRMLASCLVDADFLDTEAHFDFGVDRNVPTLGEVHSVFSASVEEMFGSTLTTPLNAARSRYRSHVVKQAASAPPGLYRLTGRTGVGKTISGTAAALAHAEANGMRRVVIAVPYTTITEQTADSLVRLCRTERAVLEHHSAVSEGNDSMWRRLASENWDAPIVVTTNVQLFESLFARNPSKIRKLHRLAGTVIVIDEPQALPAAMLEPIIDALNWLCEYAGSSVVLQTATQPAFDLIGPLQGRVIPDWGDIDLGDVFDRVRWHHIGRQTHDEIAAVLQDRTQVLCVVNTVKDAQRIAIAADTVCLTTRMCPQHRRSVLDDVIDDLREGRVCRVVATQLIEAGVDVDFPEVWRAEGPLTSLAQAAGRCNRNGRLPGLGDAVTFDLVDGGLPPGEYRTGTGYTIAARRFFGSGFQPEQPEVLRWWYEHLFGYGTGTGPVPLDARGINDKRTRFDFPDVAGNFNLIDPTVAVVVPWGEPADRNRVRSTIDAVRAGRRVTSSQLRHLGRFSVGVRSPFAAEAAMQGLLEVIERDQQQRATLALWHGRYDERLGLITDTPSTEEATHW